MKDDYSDFSDDIDDLNDILEEGEGSLKRKRKRKRPILFYSLVIVLILIISGYFIGREILEIKVIEIIGESKYSNTQIMAASKISLGANYLYIDKETAIKNIDKEFTYLENTEINYKLFSRIQIRIAEATPTYYMSYMGEYVLLSDQFKILEYPLNVEPPSSLAELTGLELLTPVPGEYAEFAGEYSAEKKLSLMIIMEEMEKQEVFGISFIDITDIYNVELEIEGRILVIFGKSFRAERKVKNLIHIMNENYTDGQSARIDLSFLEGSDPMAFDLQITSIEAYRAEHAADIAVPMSEISDGEEESSSEEGSSGEESSTAA